MLRMYIVGRCWLLLVVVGCCWLLLVVVGRCWLLLVVGGCCGLLLLVVVFLFLQVAVLAVKVLAVPCHHGYNLACISAGSTL